MKIVINGTYIPEQKSGLAVVSSNLVDRLLADKEKFDYTLYGRIRDWQKKYSDRIIVTSDRLSPDRGISGHLERLLWYQTKLNWQLRQQQIDLFYSPVHEGMLFPSTNQIVTVHDLIPLKYPAVSPKWRYYYLYVLPLILRRSRKIVSISEHTKKDLIEQYQIEPQAIEVIYNGLDGEVFYPQKNPEILAQYNLNKYLLYVGDMRFYKNLDRCLQAFDRLPLKDYQFVITGKKDDFFYPQLQQKIKGLAVKERIVFLDYVPTADLPGLYSWAECLVFASLYEGFGLPILEAMACGCPVITSDRTSLPEVGGDSVLYVNPDDTDDIAAVMYRVLTDSQLRQDLKHKGIARAKKFSWNLTAKKLTDLFSSFL